MFKVFLAMALAGALGPAGGEAAPSPARLPVEYTATNPTAGPTGVNASIYVKVVYPSSYSGGRLPAIMLVPGGTSDSSLFESRGNEARQVADAGFIAVLFDPEGRGRSTGVEDYNGHRGQDALKAVLDSLATTPGLNVDPSQIGIATNSQGVALAAGMLSRYPTASVRFLLDWEGPYDRTDMESYLCTRPFTRCGDAAWWAEREPSGFMASIRVPYVRLQSQTDHVQPDLTHAVSIYNAAVAGCSPFVRLNDYAERQSFSGTPAMYANTVDRSVGTLYATHATDLLARSVSARC
jgi:pimeloyl-ACP methyl ester carboxylesterase